MNIEDMEKIAAGRTKGDIFEKTLGNIEFIGTADNNIDKLIAVAKASLIAIQEMICTCSDEDQCSRCYLYESLKDLEAE